MGVKRDDAIVVEAKVGCVAAILLQMIALVTDCSGRRSRLLSLDGLGRAAPINILQALIRRGLAAPLESLLMMSLHLHRLEVVI